MFFSGYNRVNTPDSPRAFPLNPTGELPWTPSGALRCIPAPNACRFEHLASPWPPKFTQRIVEAWEYYLLPWLKVAAKSEFIRMKTKEENESHTLDSLYATLTNVLTTFSRNLTKLPKCKMQLLGMSSFIVQE